MIPKKIHLCWFGSDDFPVEIKRCLDSWRRVLPDFEVRRWTYDDAKAIGIPYIDQALAAKKWAFAADVVRFYAVYHEGGIYMDSDILVHRRFDEMIPEHGFATFHEHIADKMQLQAAFFMGEQGNAYCRQVLSYYENHPFLLPDGTYDITISPVVMLGAAKDRGYRPVDEEQRLADDVVIYPGYFVTPRNSHIEHHPDAIALHTIYGSWRHRKWGRRVELFFKHCLAVCSYYLFRR